MPQDIFGASGSSVGNDAPSIDKAIQVLKLSFEGVSVRSAERITGVEKKTTLSLLERVGERCEMLLENLIRDVAVQDVQCDEIWG